MLISTPQVNFIFCLLFCFITLVQPRNDNENPELGDLKFVSVLYRHGDRTPTNFYPNDPYKNISLWPDGLGQLTNVGKQQHFELGQWLRQRYDSLLTEKYSRDIIYVQSTDVDRTIMSAQCNLAGMYPPRGTQVWNKDLEWQPIPVHTVPSDKDNSFTGYAPCPAYAEELDKVMDSEEIQNLNKKYHNVYKVLNEHTGEKKYDLNYIFDIYSILFIEHLKGFALPKWTKSVFPDPITEAATHSFTLETRTKKLARFTAGLMLRTMADDMEGKRDGRNHSNVHVYSGHEQTVANLLSALGVFHLHNPPYAACVMIELRVKPPGKYVVTIFYRKTASEEPELLTLPGCDTACPLDKFISLYKHLFITPEEWDRECHTTEGNP